MRKNPLLSGLLLLCVPLSAQADETAPLAGHSNHGEVFNEGPRQSAYLMGGTGDVHFPVTAKDEHIQKLFDQGIGQLHGFWYFEAERTFRQVAALDPDCAMAYWGMAMANNDNADRAPGFAAEAWSRRDQAGDRERKFIAALARYWDVAEESATPGSAASGDASGDDPPDGVWADGSGAVVASEPCGQGAEVEVAVIETGEKVAVEKKAIKREFSKSADKARRDRLVQDLEEIVYEHPDDIEAKAFLVNRIWLNSRDAGMDISSKGANQALLEQIFAKAPMHPAHHYRIHLWDKKETAHRVVDSAARSGQTAPGIAHMWHMGGHIFDKLHRHADAAWQQEASARVDHAQMMRDHVLPDQIFNYAHNNEWLVRSLSHVGRVRDALDLAKNMVELPRHPTLNSLEDGPSRSARYGRRRLLDTLERFELWDEALVLADTMYLEPGESVLEQAKRRYLLARAHLAKGDLERAEAERAALGELVTQAKVERAEDVDEAEEEVLADGGKDAHEAMSGALRKHERPLRTLRQLHARIEGLAQLARGEGDVAEILTELDGSGLRATHRALLHLAHGDPARAEELARDAVEDAAGRADRLATLAHVLWERKDETAAKATFDELRALSAGFDLDLPAFARVAPIAIAQGLGDDWRLASGGPDDVGERPDLDTLGPFRWTPAVAADWSLPNETGQAQRLADYRNKPVLVVFFLGFGCVHCVEQLQALRPATADFEEAGISIVTIGTDTVEQLAESLGSGDEGFPFPILADPELEVFEQYRCFDDFEKMALHGTFLIDADGRVRWQDISYEPFVDIEFLLQESKRLLALPVRG